MKKRFLLLVLAVSMVCTGCGKNKEETTETASTEEIEDLESTENETTTEEGTTEDWVNKVYSKTYGEDVGVVFESDYDYTEQVDTSQQEAGITYAVYTCDYMIVTTGFYTVKEGQTVETLQDSILAGYEGVTFGDGCAIPVSQRSGTIAKMFTGLNADSSLVYNLYVWQDDAGNIKECCCIFSAAVDESLTESCNVTNTMR